MQTKHRGYGAFVLGLILLAIGCLGLLLGSGLWRPRWFCASSETPPSGIDLMVAAWERAAEAEDVPPALCATVSTILHDGMRNVATPPSHKQVAALEDSLRDFAASQYGLHDPAQAARSGTWLTFCVLEALRRTTAPADHAQALNQCRETADTLSTLFRKRLFKELPPEQHDVFRRQIEGGTAAWGPALTARLEALSDDPLYPAFKTPVSGGYQDVVERFRKREFPRYEEPDRMMITREEFYRSQLKGFFENTTGEALFWMTMANVHSNLLWNNYWGHMTYEASGQPLAWPVEVRMTVNAEKNRTEGWHRE